MARLTAIYETVLQHTDEVIRRWEAQVQDEPWLRLPPAARIDHLPQLLRAIIDVLLARPDPASARERAIRTALEHGRHRRQNGFDDGLLHREHYLLRAAVWSVIRERAASTETGFPAIARFDVVLTHTTAASLYGYHLVDGHGPMTDDQIVDRLTQSDQPWPPPPDQDRGV